MTQNIYDDPGFFDAYSRLGRSREGLDGAAEWPALRSMLPALAGARVVDLGCGYGWFCRWARAEGAAAVTGFDVSRRMLERARSMTDDPAIAYRVADLETLHLPPGGADLVFSSLAFHYVADFERLIRTIHAGLAPGGRLVFSNEHPVFMAPGNASWLDAGGRRVWPLDRYFDEGDRITNWLGSRVVKRHRTVSTILGTLLRSGLVLRDVAEWAPDAADLAAHPDWAEYRERPIFLLVGARK